MKTTDSNSFQTKLISSCFFLIRSLARSILLSVYAFSQQDSRMLMYCMTHKHNNSALVSLIFLLLLIPFLSVVLSHFCLSLYLCFPPFLKHKKQMPSLKLVCCDSSRMFSILFLSSLIFSFFLSSSSSLLLLFVLCEIQNRRRA